jgi:hypothetical protein
MALGMGTVPLSCARQTAQRPRAVSLPAQVTQKAHTTRLVADPEYSFLVDASESTAGPHTLAADEKR